MIDGMKVALLTAIRAELRGRVAGEVTSDMARGSCAMIDDLLTRLMVSEAVGPVVTTAQLTGLRRVLGDAADLAREAGMLAEGEAEIEAALHAEGYADGDLEQDRLTIERLLEGLMDRLQRTPAVAGRAIPLVADLIGIRAERHAAEKAAMATVGGSAEAPVERAVDAAHVEAYLRARAPDRPGLKVLNWRELSGGFSKTTYLLEVTGMEDGTSSLVVRRDRPGGPTGTTVVDEYPILRTMHRQGVPVPEPLWLETDAAKLGSPFIVMRRVDGDMAGPIGRPDLAVCNVETARDLARILARLHSLDPANLGLGGEWTAATTPHEAVLHMIRTFKELYRRRRHEADPVMEASLHWLETNIPAAPPRVSVVHADLGFPNMLVRDGRITALLDWELTHPGDAAEDISYIRPYIEQLIPWDEFVALYEASGGNAYSQDSADYFDIWRTIRNAIYSIACIDGFLAAPANGVAFAFGGLRYYGVHLDHASTAIKARMARASTGS